MNGVLVSDLLRQSSIKTENKLMGLSDSSWKYCPDTGRSTEVYNIFYQVGPIYHGTHDPGPVDQSITESKYNASCTAVMALEHLRMLIH